MQGNLTLEFKGDICRDNNEARTKEPQATLQQCQNKGSQDKSLSYKILQNMEFEEWCIHCILDCYIRNIAIVT